MQAIAYYILLPLLWLTSLLPFWVLYRLSDLFYLFVRLIGYRKSTILESLRYSFPDKSEKELNQIKNKFYRHFCDLFFETIKIHTVSAKTMKKRVIYKNTEYVEEWFKKGKDVIGVLAHYGNWEWVPTVNLHVSAQGCEVYRPLHNKYFDKYMLFLRSRFGTLNFKMKSVLRDVLTLKRANKRYFLGLISDQTPGKPQIQYYTEFLNQNTPIHLGPEKISSLMKNPVVFLHMDKVKRGYYEINIIPLEENPQDTELHDITNRHVKLLEEIITKRPELWLWSHKRWKHSNPRVLPKTDKPA